MDAAKKPSTPDYFAEQFSYAASVYFNQRNISTQIDQNLAEKCNWQRSCVHGMGAHGGKAAYSSDSYHSAGAHICGPYARRRNRPRREYLELSFSVAVVGVEEVSRCARCFDDPLGADIAIKYAGRRGFFRRVSPEGIAKAAEHEKSE
jgi:hypothetical protein